jgi:hypothetical protein
LGGRGVAGWGTLGGRPGLGWWEGFPAKRLSGVFIKAITIEFSLLYVEIKFSYRARLQKYMDAVDVWFGRGVQIRDF